MLRTVLCCLIFIKLLFASQPLVAQKTSKTDSLLQALSRYDAVAKNRAPELRDTAKGKILQKLILQYVDSEPKTALTYSLQLLALSQKIKYNKGIADGHLFVGGIYNRLGNHEKAITELKISATLFSGMKDQESVSKAYAELGIVYSKLGNFSEGLYYNLASLKIFEHQKDAFAIASAQINIGILYNQHDDYVKALQYYNAALETTKKLPPADADYVQGYTYNSMGQTYLKQRKTTLALEYLQRAKEKALPFNDMFQNADIGLSIGKTYLAQDKPQLALENFNEALDLYTKNDAQTGIAESLLQIGRAYFKVRNYPKALQFTNRALATARKIGQKEFVRDAYANLSDIANATQNYKAAYENQVLFKHVNDSLFNAGQDKKLTEQQMTYEFGKKQAVAKAAQLEKDNETQAAAKRQTIIINTIIAFLLIVLAVAVVIFRSLRRNQKQKKLIGAQKSILESQNGLIQQSLTEKETLLREIHHRVKNNLQIISSLLNIQSEDIEDANVLSSIREGQSRVEAMSLIHQNLYQSEHLNNVDIENYMKGLVEYLSKMFRGESDSVAVTIETSGLRFDIDTAIPLGLIVNELVSNAYKYAFDAKATGEIGIRISAKNDTDYELKVSNNGKPLPEGFDPKQSKSLGLKLVAILSRQLRGKFYSASSGGLTSFTVDFKDLKAWHASN